MKKYLSLLVAIAVMMMSFAGCGEKMAVSEGEIVDFAINEMGNEVEDSSDLPDWKGKKLDLKMWYCSGTGSAQKSNKATEDVVRDEMYRVTGVRFSDDSFDNNGDLMDAKIAKIAAADDWPDILASPEPAVLNQLIEADLVYDLTDLLPKYCPNFMKLMELNKEMPFFESGREDGKFYGIATNASVDYQYPDIDPNLLARIKNIGDPYGYVYVRDDILKMIYPEAKTQKEIEELYVKNGSFTEEEILDVCFNNKEEFFEFLYKIKSLGLKSGNREIYPFYVADGIDNWSLLCMMGCLYGYNLGGNGGNCNYFTYWDKESKQIEYMFAQPFFKDVLHDWTKLVQDGIASRDSLIDNKAVFDEKVSSGQYAVLYGQALPNQNVLNAAGVGYGYRKVYIKVPANHNKFLFSNMPNIGTGYCILKKNVKEEDLPQILRFFDFAISKAGQRLVYWGPRSAGLFTEENGVRKFVDKDLEAESVYNVPGDKKVYYGLEQQSWPGYPMCASIDQPKLVYDYEPKASMANKYFSMGTIETPKKIASDAGNIWTFDKYGIKGVQKFWAARQAFEDALTKIFISKNDKEFTKHYKEMLSTAKRNGLDDKTLDEINAAYKVINEKFMHNLK